ncbi:MAG: endonuclease MutS2 [Candidatus Marinimicrobia bacterium]|nr:endonuclease MutS2 [Candidatus Neomarinimicrobiota bacterium]
MAKNEVCTESVLESLDFPFIKELLFKSLHSEASAPLVEALKPTSTIADLKHKLQLVTEMRAIHSDGERFPIEQFEDIESGIGVLKKEGRVLSAESLDRIGVALRLAHSIKLFMKDREESQSALYALSEGFISLPKVEKRIAKTIGPEGEILDSASSELRKIRKSIRTTEGRMRKRLDEILAKLIKDGIARDSNPTIRNGRFVLPVKIEHKRQLKGVIHDSSASGTTVFIEPVEVIELSNVVQGLKFDERREIEKILEEITVELRPQAEELALSFETLKQCDLIYAKSELSKEMNGTAPEIFSEGELLLKDARNPLLEKLREVIPLDFAPGDGINTVVITGPNAGGKTVALKTVGLLTLMAQSGLHLPVAEESKLIIYNKIFADIGDKQSIAEDLSTFTSHMKNLKEILDDADEKSLVLVDEIGTGTDPTEGAAFSSAFLEEISKRGAMTVVTTHHSSLKELAQNRDRFINCSMEFDVDRLTPTFKFVKGIPGSSYALEISRKLGIDEKLIKRAEELIGSGAVRVDSLLTELERERQKLHKTEKELNAMQEHLQEMISEYEDKMERFKSDENKLKAEAAREAKEILTGANAAIERAVREIKESRADSNVIKNIKHRISGQKAQIEDVISSEKASPKEDSVPLSLEDAEIGMDVSIPSLNVTGQIQEIRSDKNDAVVSVGSTNIIIAVNKLRAAASDKKKSLFENPAGYGGPELRAVTPELSLRGMRAEEAISVLEKYLDDALLAGFSSVEVIHGKGEGVLRKLVAEQLEAHPRVKSFHTAALDRGGYGVTVAEFKKS